MKTRLVVENRTALEIYVAKFLGEKDNRCLILMWLEQDAPNITRDYSRILKPGDAWVETVQSGPLILPIRFPKLVEATLISTIKQPVGTGQEFGVVLEPKAVN